MASSPASVVCGREELTARVLCIEPPRSPYARGGDANSGAVEIKPLPGVPSNVVKVAVEPVGAGLLDGRSLSLTDLTQQRERGLYIRKRGCRRTAVR